MRRLFLAAVIGIAGASAAIAQSPLGTKPAHTGRALTAVPNAQAIERRLWVPGLDDGYVPQGLTVVGEALFVAAYKSTDRKQDRGPCRLYRLDRSRGVVTGMLDLPPACGHAGGLAKGPAGTLHVVDTRIVFEVKLGAVDDRAIGRVVKTVKLGGAVKGSFAAGTGEALWLGAFDRQPGARLFRIPHARLVDGATVTEVDAAASVPLPTEAQGAAFDPAGKLWISRSTGKFGELMRVHPATGAVEARFEIAAGLEDLSFDGQGRLWALSEAGSRRWNDWPTFFPLVFSVDVAKLKQIPGPSRHDMMRP